MLSNYLDIRVLSDPEATPAELMEILFGRLHQGLVAFGAGDLAVSFPGHSLVPLGLGTTLRLLGGKDRLAQFMQTQWLGGMAGRVAVSPIQEVPSNAPPRQLLRVQAKSNVERLRRRQLKRHGITAEQAAQRVPFSAQERLSLPFVRVRSQSTRQGFMLFLRLGPALAAPRSGVFNAYGLSVSATIPWF